MAKDKFKGTHVETNVLVVKNHIILNGRQYSVDALCALLDRVQEDEAIEKAAAPKVEVKK